MVTYILQFLRLRNFATFMILCGLLQFIAYMNIEYHCGIAIIPSLLSRINQLLHLCINTHVYCLVCSIYISFKFGG